jgi:hypothetical protein
LANLNDDYDYDDGDDDVENDLKSMISMHLLMTLLYWYYVMVQYCQTEVVLNLWLMLNFVVVVGFGVGQNDDGIPNEIVIFLLVYPNKMQD